MKIEFLPPIIPVPDDTGRSPGLHVSGLIHHIMRKGKMRQYKLASEVSKEDWKRAYNRWEAGFIYEAVASREYAARRAAEVGAKVLLQVEVEKDGVYGTLDALDLGDWGVHDWKYTHLSFKRWREVELLRRLKSPILPKWMWSYEVQLKSYAYMVDSDQTQLHIMFGSGDYRGSGPIPKRIRMWWTRPELERNWGMLISQKDAVLREGTKWALA